jgi:hypothetical protein
VFCLSLSDVIAGNNSQKLHVTMRVKKKFLRVTGNGITMTSSTDAAIPLQLFKLKRRTGQELSFGDHL